MGWFRKQLRFGFCIALLALTLSLILSFGHVHLSRAAMLPAASVPTAIADQRSAPTPPAHKDPLCAVCVLIHLGGTLVHPVAPSLELPQSALWTSLDSFIVAKVWISPALPFRARGPPTAVRQG